MSQYFNLLLLLILSVYSNEYRWYSVSVNDIISTTNLRVSGSYTQDSNNDGFLLVTATGIATDCVNPAGLIIFINPFVVEEAIGIEQNEWQKIRYTQHFSGCASCWTVFGGRNAHRVPDVYGLIPYNSTFDTLIKDNLVKGTWIGQTNRCDNDASNHWHRNNGCGSKGSLRVELRRNMSASHVGIGTGYDCGSISTSFKYSFIEVGYDSVPTSTTSAISTTYDSVPTSTTSAISTTYDSVPTSTTSATSTTYDSVPTSTTSAISTTYVYAMQTIDGSYRCNTLTDNIDIMYDIDYNQCLEECMYRSECFMISYLFNGKT
eukprot:137488_1